MVADVARASWSFCFPGAFATSGEDRHEDRQANNSRICSEMWCSSRELAADNRSTCACSERTKDSLLSLVEVIGGVLQDHLNRLIGCLLWIILPGQVGFAVHPHTARRKVALTFTMVDDKLLPLNMKRLKRHDLVLWTCS